MKKTYFILLSILLVFSCVKEKSQFDLLKYEEHIDNAETFLIKNDLKSALLSYYEGDKYLNNMMAVDIYNALIISCKLEKWNDALFWSKKILKKGVSLELFNKKIFNKYKTTNEWVELKSEFDSFNSRFLKNMNKNLYDSISILRKIDQQNYCNIPTGKILLDDAYDKTIFLDSLFSNLLKTNGFPSEEKIGVSIEKDTILAVLPTFYPLIKHSYQSESNSLDSFLKNAVDNGLLKRSLYVDISANTGNMPFVVINCRIYQNRFARLDSVELINLKNKITFKNKRINNDYLIYAPLIILDGSNIDDTKEQFEMMFSFVEKYNGCG